jgi:hypothetical protein
MSVLGLKHKCNFSFSRKAEICEILHIFRKFNAVLFRYYFRRNLLNNYHLHEMFAKSLLVLSVSAKMFAKIFKIILKLAGFFALP